MPDPDVLAERIAALERAMKEGFVTLREQLESSMRHRDHNQEQTVRMLSDTIKRLEENQRDGGRRWATWQAETDERLRSLEDQQLTWISNSRLLVALGTTLVALGGVAGSIVSTVLS